MRYIAIIFLLLSLASCGGVNVVYGWNSLHESSLKGVEEYLTDNGFSKSTAAHVDVWVQNGQVTLEDLESAAFVKNKQAWVCKQAGEETTFCMYVDTRLKVENRLRYGMQCLTGESRQESSDANHKMDLLSESLKEIQPDLINKEQETK